MSTFKNPVCRGSLALGNGCGRCERCAAERAWIAQRPQHAPSEALAANQRAVNEAKAIRRERIATAALQGLLSDGFFADSPEKSAKAALRYADALIAELDRKGEEG